ncbi:hypothetical protein [Lysobacter sp. HA18]
MEQVDRYFEARSALSKAAKSDKSLADLEAVEAETEAQHATRVAANSKAVAILARAGTTPEEFAHMARLLPAAYVAYSMLLSGPVTKLPEGIDPALVDFMRIHGAEVAAKAKALMY